MYVVWQQINKNEWRLNAKNGDKAKALKAYAGCVKSVGVNKCRLTEDITPKLDLKAVVVEEEVETSEKPNKFIRTREYGAQCKILKEGATLTKLDHGAWCPCINGNPDGKIWKKMDSDGYIVIRVFSPEPKSDNRVAGHYPEQTIKTKEWDETCDCGRRGDLVTTLQNGKWVLYGGPNPKGEIEEPVDRDGYVTIKVYAGFQGKL